MAVIVDLDPAGADTLNAALGGEALVLTSVDALRRHLDVHLGEDCVVVGPVGRPGHRPRAGRGHAGHATEPGLRARPSPHRHRRCSARPCGPACARSSRSATSPGSARAVRRTRDARPGHARTASSRPRARTRAVRAGGSSRSSPPRAAAARRRCRPTWPPSLADRGKREVCLVDLDLAFGDVAIALQLFPSHTIADAVPLGDTLDVAGRRRPCSPRTPPA